MVSNFDDKFVIWEAELYFIRDYSSIDWNSKVDFSLLNKVIAATTKEPS